MVAVRFQGISFLPLSKQTNTSKKNEMIWKKRKTIERELGFSELIPNDLTYFPDKLTTIRKTPCYTRIDQFS